MKRGENVRLSRMAGITESGGLMRNPANNPIERMERLLDNIDELLAAFEHNARLMVANGLAPMARPPMIEYEKECVRRSLDYKRVRRTRRAMEHIRNRGGSVKGLAAVEGAEVDAHVFEAFGKTTAQMRAEAIETNANQAAFTLAEIEARLAKATREEQRETLKKVGIGDKLLNKHLPIEPFD